MDVTIEKLIYGGEGLAHHEGSTVFVPFVLPGEKVEATPVERKKKFVRARLNREIERSPERIAAPCPHFGVCGGCDYQHISYEGQLRYKIEILRETLRRLGRIDWPGEIKAHASPGWNYRNRAQWKVRPIGEGPGALAETAPPKEAAMRPSVSQELKRLPLTRRESSAARAGIVLEDSGTLAEQTPREKNASQPHLMPQREPRPTNSSSARTDHEANAGNGSARRMEGQARTPKLGIGYFRANSTALCPVKECTILSPLLLKSFLALREAVISGAFPRTLREIEAFVDANDSKILLTATFSGFPSQASELVEKIRGFVPETESLLFFDPTREQMELSGPGFIDYETLGVKYRVGHFSFFQVNRFLVEDLALAVAGDDAASGERGGRLALDLFAGVGLFSVPLAKRFDRVVAVESNPAAGRDLESNVRAGGSIEVRIAEVERFLERYKEKPQLVVIDPPRAGLAPGVIKRLLRIAPEQITYVSCEPPTLARDLAALREGGYDIFDVQLFDLFPQTFHMEAVVRLNRR